MNVNFKTTSKSSKAGTKSKPRPANLSIELTQSTRSGTGQPASSAALNITLPKEFRFTGRTWPKKLRCDPIKANQAKSDSACPRRSSIGTGHVTASAGNGTLFSEIAVRAYVTTSGDLGLWLSTATPLPINQMLRVLRFTLERGVESTGCPASKQWTLTFQNVYTQGSTTDATRPPAGSSPRRASRWSRPSRAESTCSARRRTPSAAPS